MLHLRSSNATFRCDSSCFRNSSLIKKNDNLCAKIKFYKKTKTSNRLYHNDISYLYFYVLLCSKDVCICEVSPIGFKVSETCLRVAIHEALLQCEYGTNAGLETGGC